LRDLKLAIRSGVERRMTDDLKRFVIACWQSRLGRALFLIHLIVAMTFVGYVWNNQTMELTAFFYPFRRLYFCLNWPTLQVLQPYIQSINSNGASRLGDAWITFLCSIPWLLFGSAAEVFAKDLSLFLNRRRY
jgi:hypothetical protein